MFSFFDEKKRGNAASEEGIAIMKRRCSLGKRRMRWTSDTHDTVVRVMVLLFWAPTIQLNTYAGKERREVDHEYTDEEHI